MAQATTLTTISELRSVTAAMKPELERALRDRIPVDYFLRVLMTTVQRQPDLLLCTRASLLGSVMEGAQLGLITDGVTGYGYIIPRNRKVNGTWQKEATFMAGYKGLIQLAYRGGAITKVVGRSVREGDAFAYRLGTREEIEHVPSIAPERGSITHFYAVAWQRSGPPIFVVLPVARVAEIRDRATAQNGGKVTPAWSGDFETMGCKTSVRSLFRWLPLELEAHRQAAREEAIEAGEDDPGDLELEVASEIVDSPAAPEKRAIESLLSGEDGGDEEDEPWPGPSGAPAPDPEPQEDHARFKVCPTCSGSGEVGDGRDACPECGGTGDVPDVPAASRSRRPRGR